MPRAMVEVTAMWGELVFVTSPGVNEYINCLLSEAETRCHLNKDKHCNNVLTARYFSQKNRLNDQNENIRPCRVSEKLLLTLLFLIIRQKY